MDVSIILVSYNTKDITRACLNSIFSHTKELEFEVFVVDNASDDDSVKMIEAEFPQVKLIKNSANLGFGVANNIAIKMSDAKYIFCLNTDTVLFDNAIKHFFDFMQEEKNQIIGVCGCNLINLDGQSQTFGGKFPSGVGLFFKIFLLDKIFKDFYNKYYRISIKDINVKPDFVSGAALFIRKKIINEIGAFDEKFFLYYEETDLCKRIQNAGYKIAFIPEIKILHLESKSPIKTIQQLRINANSQCYYYKKHVGYLAFLILKIYNCFKILLFKFNKKAKIK